MKKYSTLAVVFVAAVLIGLVAYSVIQLRTTKTDNDKKQVLTTFTVLADMAKNVAGDRADVDSLTKPGAEIHGYEPTPQDLVRLQKADIVLDNGMNLEKWAEKLYQNIGSVPHVTLTDGIEPMSIAEGPYKDKPNPHAWMSPKNALTYVDTITKALSDIDPDNAQYYGQNAANYKSQIEAVDTTLKNGLSELPESNRYMISCEGAFSYLIRDYGLKQGYLWPINADAQGTPQQIRSVVEMVRENKVPAVFCESTVNDKAQRQVAAESGARFGGVFYVDSLSGADGPTPTYLKLLEYNARTLIEGLRLK
ncbi:MAG: metal ABC transporter substrate-binding protein [Candidatus Saccharibacteria bacterium]|nr:MAG: metal ABC transporter substrate-binding protein [Candidatus Saccharibacteria bacterium]